MRTATLAGLARSLARIAPTYCFMYFLGPVVWQLWMALRLGFVSLEESRNCLLSPRTLCIAVLLFALNMVNLTRGAGRIGSVKDGAASRRMAVHCSSLLAFATIGTICAMSAISGAAEGGGRSPTIKLIVGSINGASMCFIFYAASTASAIARLSPPGRRPGEGERRTVALTRAFNACLFATGLPLFIGTSLAAASLGGRTSAALPSLALIASLALPATMGSALFLRADKRIAALLDPVGAEVAR